MHDAGLPAHGLASKLQDRRFARFHFQVELRQPLRHFRDESPRVRFLLEAGYVVVGVTNEVGAAFTAPGKACFEPEVEYVVQVAVAQHGRDQPSLRRKGQGKAMKNTGWKPAFVWGNGNNRGVFRNNGRHRFPAYSKLNMSGLPNAAAARSS